MDCRERVERTRPAATLCVSACLLGCACRYDGKSVPDPQIIALGTYFHLVPLCPEQMGGLPTPRTPSEYNGTAVMMQNGTCVTDAFFRGAREALRLIRLHGAIGVILKDKSPSCGVGTRYDGSFTKTLTDGDGVTAELLRREGIPVLAATRAHTMTPDHLRQYFLSSER